MSQPGHTRIAEDGAARDEHDAEEAELYGLRQAISRRAAGVIYSHALLARYSSTMELPRAHAGASPSHQRQGEVLNSVDAQQMDAPQDPA